LFYGFFLDDLIVLKHEENCWIWCDCEKF